MEIELKKFSVRELTKNYEDNEEAGVVGFDGKLDIRPPYQREFIYKDKQRDAVIETASREFPLNVMYWAVRGDGGYEVIDGQQRTISLCQYIDGDFSVQIGNFPEKRAFHNLQSDEQERLLDYKLMVYLCSGTDSEKLEWFKTINIAGLKLTNQELLNAVYHGTWVSDAKRYFSKRNCPAYGIASDYLSGAVDRQEYLETAIKWIAKSSTVESYMSEYQKQPNANELWLYFNSVINWVKVVFPKYRREMKGIDWGYLYNNFGNGNHDSAKLEKEISALMEDEDVTKKKGIYFYVLERKEKYLNIRAFTPNQRRESYERQDGICPVCNKKFDIKDMEADHITPWHKGGKTNAENCQMLCKEDNRRKSGI